MTVSVAHFAWAACVDDGPKKLKTYSLVTWAATRAMAWAALVLGPSMAAADL